MTCLCSVTTLSWDTIGTHQNLEEHYDELIASHEVAVQHAKVKPAPQAAEHLDQHFFIIP